MADKQQQQDPKKERRPRRNGNRNVKNRKFREEYRTNKGFRTQVRRHPNKGKIQVVHRPDAPKLKKEELVDGRYAWTLGDRHAIAANLGDRQGQQVERPKFNNGTPQVVGFKESMTAWDDMMVAKVYPGQHNVKYVAGMSVTNLPTNIFTVSNTFAEANRFTQPDDDPLGTGDYLLIMFSPAMSAFVGDRDGQANLGHFDTNTKLSGLVLKQFNEADIDTPYIQRDIFQEEQAGRTMLELYGSDMTQFSAGGFVWAAEATMNILAPRANSIDSYFQGSLQFGQMDQALTMRQLLEIAGSAKVMQPQFHMRGAVVNNNLVYSSQRRGQKGETPDGNDFVGEVVNYVILQKPAMNITDGTNAKFSLQVNVKGNGVFWANPQDTIANNLFKTNRQAKSPMPGMLAGTSQNVTVKPPAKSSFWDKAKHLASQAWAHREAIGGAINAARSMASLLADPAPPDDAESRLVKANYVAQLNHCNDAIAGLLRMNPLLIQEFQMAQQLLKQQYDYCSKAPGRLVPMIAEVPNCHEIEEEGSSDGHDQGFSFPATTESSMPVRSATQKTRKGLPGNQNRTQRWSQTSRIPPTLITGIAGSARYSTQLL